LHILTDRGAFGGGAFGGDPFGSGAFGGKKNDREVHSADGQYSP